MTTQPRETYLKVGRVTSLCIITSVVLGGLLITSMKFSPGTLSNATIEGLQISIGLFFFFSWAATIGCYSIAFNKRRTSTWFLFGIFPPFALYAMLILIIQGSSKNLPSLGAPALGLFALRAAVGWD